MNVERTEFRVFVFSRLTLGLIALGVVGCEGPALAQSQIVNAQLTTRQATRGLDAEIQSVAAAGGAGWVA